MYQPYSALFYNADLEMVVSATWTYLFMNSQDGLIRHLGNDQLRSIRATLRVIELTGDYFVSYCTLALVAL